MIKTKSRQRSKVSADESSTSAGVGIELPAEQQYHYSPSKVPLDLSFAQYPHILAEIASLSPFSTLAALMRCNKHLHHAVRLPFYKSIRHLHSTQQQVEKLLGVGRWAGVAPFLEYTVPGLRSLHIHSCGPDFKMPSVIQGLLDHIEAVVLYLKPDDFGPRCRGDISRFLNLPGAIGGHMSRSNLVLRMDDKQILPKDTLVHFDDKEHKTTYRNITVMIPMTHIHPTRPFVLFRKHRDLDSLNPKYQSRMRVTTVMLPPVLSPGRTGSRDASPCSTLTAQMNQGIFEVFYGDRPSFQDSRLIGSEVLGDAAEALQTYLNNCLHGGGLVYPVTFSTFRAWLESQKAGEVISAEEVTSLSEAWDKLMELFASDA